MGAHTYSKLILVPLLFHVIRVIWLETGMSARALCTSSYVCKDLKALTQTPLFFRVQTKSFDSQEIQSCNCFFSSNRIFPNVGIPKMGEFVK